MSDTPQVIHRRAATFERSAVDREARTARLTFSSETPVQRSFGVEVLDHSQGSVRMGRLNSGAPVLWGHDDERQASLLGVVETASIGDDRRGHAVVRFGRSPEAERALCDAEDGVLRNVSVGYILHDKPQGERGADGKQTFRFKDWEPYEISLLPVPADTAVGVGRGVEFTPEAAAERAPDPEVQPAAPAAIPVIEVRKMEQQTQAPDAGQIESARVARILALSTDADFGKYITPAETRAAIEGKTSADAFSEAVTRKLVAANNADAVGTAGSSVLGSLSAKDQRRYSLVRAHRAAIRDVKMGAFAPEDDKLEREVSAEIAKRLGKSTGGIYVPNTVTRTQTASATGAGLTALTSVINTITESDVIEMYRNRARVLALGATRLGGLSGLIRLPRQTGAGSGQWLAETGAVTGSNVTTDFVAISPKRFSVQNAYTVELLAESSVDVEGMLARDRAKVLDLAIDQAAINGPSGGASPVGLLNTTGLALITSSGATLTAGKALGYADWLAFESTVAAANADSASCGFLVTPETRGQAKGTPMFPSGYAMPIWSSNQRDPDGLETGPLGYKAGVTNQVPKNYGTGTNLHAAIFGDFSQIIVADYGASELIVDPYTQAAAGVYVVTERVLMDIEIRHITAFAACETVAVV